jgi:hypothetical protein
VCAGPNASSFTLEHMTVVEWISAGAAGGAALASVAVAVATYQLARSTNRLGDLTAKTLSTAENQVQEAVRARADQRAPRIIAILAPTEWPPYAPPGQAAGEQAHSMPVGRRFTVPREDNTPIMLRTDGLLRNEGASTAVVQLHGRAVFYAGQSPFARSSHPGFELPPHLGGGRYALAPGETALFRFDDWRPLGEWRKAWQRKEEAPPESKLFLNISASDQFDDGIVDELGVFANEG